MTKSLYEKCQEEITRCKKLYKGFSDSSPFISSACSAVCEYFKEHPVAPLPAYDKEEAADMIRAGNSLSLNPNLKTRAAVGLLKKLGEVIAKTNPKLKATVNELDEHLDQFLLDSPEEVAKEELFNLRDFLIKETELEEDLATFLFSIMLTSFYRQYLQATSGVLRTDLWERGDCPLCGTKPHYGQLRSEDGAKQLECWLCGTQWLHTRIKCPYCNNTDMEKLGFFTVEDDEKVRVNYCQKCCQYYKIFDARKFHADGGVVLAIHNLASLDYDLLARREGFTPGSGLEWVNKDEIVEAQD